MRKRLLILPLALLLGVAGTAVIAQPQRPAPAQGGPVRELPRAQRAPATPEQIAQRRAAMCQNLHANAAGRLATLEVRLNLTANQRATFTRWRDVRLAAAQRRAQTCATAPVGPGRGGRGPAAGNAQATPPTPPNPVERMARAEQQLRQRLTDLTAERPALEALYNSLTPEQRQKFTPLGGGRNGMGRGGQRGRMAMMRGGPRGGMGFGGPRNGRGFGGPGGRGPGRPGMAPPPPPPQ
jgi:hypothetical protein